jgi:SAM-dependent methyltransferase
MRNLPEASTHNGGLDGDWVVQLHCPICNGSNLSLLCDARDHHYGNEGSWQYSRCDSCGGGFLNPFPKPELLGGFYPTTYYSFRQFDTFKDKVKSLYRRLLGIPLGAVDPRFSHAGSMLDVGCGSGTVLKAFKDRGWTVCGVEPSEQAAKLGREVFGLDILTSTLEKADLPDAQFDYVRANHSLEHMPNPHTFFKEVFRVLKPGGVLHIGVPNLDGISAKWFSSHWFLFGAPVHVFEFTPKALRLLGEQAGFSVRKVSFNSDYGSLLGSLQALVNRKKSVRVASEGWLFRNPVLVFLSQRVVKVFDWMGRGDVVEVTYIKPN